MRSRTVGITTEFSPSSPVTNIPVRPRITVSLFQTQRAANNVISLRKNGSYCNDRSSDLLTRGFHLSHSSLVYAYEHYISLRYHRHTCYRVFVVFPLLLLLLFPSVLSEFRFLRSVIVILFVTFVHATTTAAAAFKSPDTVTTGPAAVAAARARGYGNVATTACAASICTIFVRRPA